MFPRMNCFTTMQMSTCPTFTLMSHYMQDYNILLYQFLQTILKYKKRLTAKTVTLTLLEKNKANTTFTSVYLLQVRELVGQELFATYDRLLLQTTLEGMDDIVYCPRVTCQCPVMVEKESSMGVCPRCKLAFCVLCKMTYHGAAPCRLRSGEYMGIMVVRVSLNANFHKSPL